METTPHAADPPNDETEVAVRDPGHGGQDQRGVHGHRADLQHAPDPIAVRRGSGRRRRARSRGPIGPRGMIPARWPGTGSGSERSTSTSTLTGTARRPRSTSVSCWSVWPRPSRGRSSTSRVARVGHTAALRHLEYRAVGIDLSLTLLSRGRPMPAASGDMRCLPFLHGTFDWVLNFFTSFGYFENEQENFRVLEEIFRVLAPGGSFLIDLFNIDHVLTHLEPRETLERDGRRAEIHRWYDERTRRLNKRIELVGADGTPEGLPRERPGLPARRGGLRPPVGRPRGDRDLRRIRRQELRF